MPPIPLVYYTQKLPETNLFDRQARAVLQKQIEGVKSVAEKEWLSEWVAG
jgi:hypothetical protein